MYSQALSLLEAPQAVSNQPLSKYEQYKFFLQSVAPALIQPEEADTLIDYVVDESQLFKEATIQRMTTNELDIRFIDISGGVLRLAVCNQTPTESVSITNTNKCLRTISVDAKFYLCDDDLQDGITGPQLETQIMRMTADQAANELELIALMGNTNGSYSDPTRVNNDLMHARDMWWRQLQQGHVSNASSYDAGDRTISFNKLNCLHRAIPTKFRKTPESIRTYMPMDMEIDFWALHQGRETDLGDSAYVGPLVNKHLYSGIRGVALLPTNVQYCCGTSLPSTNGTFIFATDPANMVLGIQKQITFERWRDAPRHLTWLIWTLRFDALIYNEDATSMIDCMQLDACATECVTTALPNRCNGCLNSGSGYPPIS